MTPSLEGKSGDFTGCQCGGCKPAAQRRSASLRTPISEDDIRARQWEAISQGKALQGMGPTDWTAQYSGDCRKPITVGVSSAQPDRVLRYKVRCRKCGPCRNAKRSYWALAATEQTRLCQERGGRTWFGTLTGDVDAQETWQTRAFAKAQAPGSPRPDWNNPDCETRFALLRSEFLGDVQRYWKRLRKQGEQFTYFLCVERHRSGLPHGHFLLHEQGDPIRKRVLQSTWPHGFTTMSIVGGRSKNAAAPERAAWYVAKYLSKSNQARVIASAGYRPQGRRLTAVNPLNHLDGTERSESVKQTNE